MHSGKRDKGRVESRVRYEGGEVKRGGYSSQIEARIRQTGKERRDQIFHVMTVLGFFLCQATARVLGKTEVRFSVTIVSLLRLSAVMTDIKL